MLTIKLAFREMRCHTLARSLQFCSVALCVSITLMGYVLAPVALARVAA